MSGKRYPEEFKIEVVKQVVERGHSVFSVATHLDITTHSLHAWIKKCGPDSSTNKEKSDAQAETKHTAGQFGNRPNAGIEPQDSLKLFEQSVSSSKQYPNKEVRFAVDSNGNVHRFEGTNGEYHWNGSSGDTKNPLTGKQIPSDVQKQLGVKIK